jgi:hypothetical protein
MGEKEVCKTWSLCGLWILQKGEGDFLDGGMPFMVLSTLLGDIIKNTKEWGEKFDGIRR